MFDLTHDDGRRTSYRFMAPDTSEKWGVVLFSHGAYSSNASYDALWRAFAARNYLVIGANHLDSGWPDQQPKTGRSELWRTRVADMGLPLLQKTLFDDAARGLGASLDWSRVCAAGHSFGAVVAQALAGATLNDPGDQSDFHGDLPAVAACIAFSPPGPLPGFIPDTAWDTVQVPSLLQTGDTDILPGFVDDWHSRLTGFSGRPDRWTIIGRDVDHWFGGLICRLEPDAAQNAPALHQTAEIACDFLDAYIRGDPVALRALTLRAKRGDDGILTVASG